MILMFEAQIRGGYSGCLGERYIKSNNKYMKNYNPENQATIYYILMPIIYMVGQ